MSLGSYIAIAVATTFASLIARGISRAADIGQRRDAAELDAMALAEEMALTLLAQHPGLSDDAIATLMRDELVNRRAASAARMRWAHPATVGRVRRTVARY